MFERNNDIGSQPGAMRRRSGLALGVAAALAGLFSSPPSAQAQESERVKELDEIVVTATRRGAQKLIDTPLSITAFDGNWLENRGYAGLKDFIQLAPGVTMVEMNPGINRIQMRGISVGVGENNVGYYLDEVPMAFINQIFLPDMRAFDMERIEVLRGPQGTLYGAGALAGVVRAVTAPPLLDRSEFKTDLTVSSTTDGGTNYIGNLAGSLPLINDRLGMRMVYTREDNSGWIDQTRLNKRDNNSHDLGSMRLKLLGKVNDRLSVSALYWRSKVDTFGSPGSFRDRTMNNLTRSPSSYQYDIANLTVNYDADAFGVVSSTSRMAMDNTMRSDFFGGYTLDAFLDPRAFSQEIRAFSTGNGPWQWTAGAYYRNADQTQRQDSEALPLIGALPSVQYDKVISRSLFAELTRRMLDGRLELTAGVRSMDEVRTSNDRIRNSIYTNDFNVTTPRVNVTYRPAQNWMTYVNFSQGVRNGINQFAISLETAAAMGIVLPAAAEPEYADSFEWGVKGSFWNNRLVLDATAYRIKWRDMQTVVPIIQDTLDGVINAASASSPGIELALSLRATPGLQLGLTGSWNDARMDQDVYAQARAIDPDTWEPIDDTVSILVFEKGSRINDVPEWTAGITLDYTRPVRDNGMLFVLRGAAQYASAREQTSFTTVARGQDNMVVDLRVGLEGGRWGAYLFGANLLDEKDVISPSMRPGYGSRGRPRTVGINVKYTY